MSTRSLTLAEAFSLEQARVRELLLEYYKLGPVGAFGYAMIKDVLRRSEIVAAESDVVGMVRLYKELKGCQ